MQEVYLTKKVALDQKAKKAGARLVAEVWRHKKLVIAGIACELVATLIYSSMPLFLKYIIDSIVGKNMQRVGVLVVAIVGIFLVRWVIAFANTYLITLGGMRVVESLRNRTYERLQQMSFGFFEKRRAGEIMSRISNDVTVVQMFVTTSITESVRIPIGVVIALGVVIYLSAKLTLIAILIMPVILVIIAVGGKKMKKVSLSLQEQLAHFNAVVFEVLGLINVVKMFSMEDHEVGRFRKENANLVKTTMKQVTVRALYSPMVEFLGACCLALIFYIGAKDIINNRPDFITGKVPTIGDISALFLGLQQIFTQVNRINQVNLVMQHAFAAADRTFEIIDMPEDIQDKPDAVEIPEINGNIELENVSFHYNPGEPVLTDINLKIEPGMVVALVGSSGSGKSTLVKLLPRFYEVTAGSIKIEGVDVRDAVITSYRRKIGIVPQDNLLFLASFRENIAYGRPDATFEQIVDAAKAAYAHDFIMETPNGYDTVVGERGVTISGGQRQRIAIARAILLDPKILILDEATSNVDNISEKYIQLALEKLMKTRTTIVVAHRLSTVKNADLIVVLEDGRIVERGRHDELYAQGGTYRNLYNLTQVAAFGDSTMEAQPE